MAKSDKIGIPLDRDAEFVKILEALKKEYPPNGRSDAELLRRLAHLLLRARQVSRYTQAALQAAPLLQVAMAEKWAELQNSEAVKVAEALTGSVAEAFRLIERELKVLAEIDCREAKLLQRLVAMTEWKNLQANREPPRMLAQSSAS